MYRRGPRTISRIVADERGATAIEYALVAAVVAIGAIGALQLMGGEAGGMWQSTGDSLVGGLQRNQ